MNGLTLEQRERLPLLLAAFAERIRGFITSSPQEVEIIRPGEFCRSTDFGNDQDMDTMIMIYKIEKGGPDPFPVEFLSRTGEEALVRSVNLKDESALKRSIACGSLAVYHLETNMPERGRVISAFARALRQRGEVSELDAHLDEAIYYFEKAVELEPPEEINRPLYFNDLAWALTNRYKKFRREKDFSNAKRSFKLAAGISHPAESAFLSGLGQLLMDRAVFENSKTASAFDASVEALEKAIERITDQFKGSISTIFYHLGLAYTN